jgi:Putative rhamnosyl transferase
MVVHDKIRHIGCERKRRQQHTSSEYLFSAIANLRECFLIMVGTGNNNNRTGTGGRRHHQRLVPVSTLMLIMIFVTVGTNLFLASWIIPPLLDIGPIRQSESTGIHGDTNENNIDRRQLDRTNKVLHIVTTRFQQLQPHLVELGKARIKLFETFCLPTMIKQDIQDGFLWFVMTDPDLDPVLLQHLERLLRPFPHFYLVASNDKLVTPNQLVTVNKTTEFIRTGDLDRLYHDLFDIHRPLLIETRLDADDGLHGRTLSEIQRMVFEELPVDTRGWQIICSRIHYEWRNNDIATAVVHVDRGHNTTTTTTMSSGKIRLVRERICVTPGYTLVRRRPKYSIDFPVWPRTGHNLIVIEWPECSNGSPNSTATSSLSDAATYNCWKKLGNFPSAVRSRTITSAGMSRVIPASETDIYDNSTRLFWELVERDFGIMEINAQLTSKYLKHNLPHIVEDNLKGQWYVICRRVLRFGCMNVVYWIR